MDNHSKYNELLKQLDGYCKSCARPITFRTPYCSGCSKRLMIDGLEKHRVRFGSVGKMTVNYQQYLHRSFFGCNAPSEYRGKKEDRIKIKIDDRLINIAENKIYRLMTQRSFVYLGKDYYRTGSHRKLLKEICEMKNNIAKRLVYNTTLYFIAYYLENNKAFMSDAHFNASMIYSLHTNIERNYIRLTGYKHNTFRDDKYSMSNKQYYWLLQEITLIIEPILEMCVSRKDDNET